MIAAISTLIVTLGFMLGQVSPPEQVGAFAGLPSLSHPQVPTFIAPFTPLLWVTVCLWLLLSACYGLWKRVYKPGWREIRLPLCLCLALGALWVPVAQINAWAGLATLWVMAAAAAVALAQAPQTGRSMAAWPIGLLVGWLLALVCIGTAQVCLSEFGLARQEVASPVVLAIIIATVALQWRLALSPTIGLAVVWVLLGLHWEHRTHLEDVAALAAGGAVGITALSLWPLLRDLRAVEA